MDKQFLSEINQEKKKAESFEQEKFEKIKPDRTKYIWILGIVVVCLVGAYMLFNQKVTVVDMTGWTVTDATTWASTNSVQLVSSSIYSDSVAADAIISQSVSAKTKVDKKSTIQITVSLGADPSAHIVIPAFDTTWTRTRIQNWLSENSITNFTITTSEDSVRDANLFVSYTIPDTTAAEFMRKDTINFVVTIKPTTTTVTVVDLKGYAQTQVDSWASTNDITITYTTGFSSTVASGRVIAQSVAADETITGGSSMTVTLSKGIAVTMINFANYLEANAQAWAKENMINLSTSQAYSPGVAEGKSLSQSVYRGTLVEQNSSVKVVYSLGYKVLMNNFANRMLVDLQDYVAQQNALGASLKLNISYQVSDKVALNHIIAQSKFDTDISANTTLDVIVSSGKLVKIPDFSLLAGIDANATYLNIIKACEDQGIVCRVNQQTTSDLTLKGKVLSQSVAANTMVGSDTIVDVIIGK
ncbi:MAG: PASTA domain-containing protein [Erysipelotrichaceae bacterium]